MSASVRWQAAHRETYTYDQIGLPTLSFHAPSPPRHYCDLDWNIDAPEYDSPLDETAPPSYQHAIQPASRPISKRPIKFTFHPSSSRPSAVAIVPDYQSELPYELHLLKSATSYSTTGVIRRGSKEIGDFEMGYTQKSGSVSLRGKHFLISEILTRSSMYVGRGVPWKERHKQAVKNTWQWKPGDHAKRIFWDFTGPGTMTCYSSNTLDRAVKLAIFQYQGTAGANRTLEVTSEGHDVVDDILISALILERWKLEGVLK